MTALTDRVADDVLAAMSAASLPEVFWEVDDDLCDCVYQRIGMWTNPYLAETLEVRMCCIWAELYKLFPDKVRATHAFKDYNANEWVTEPQPWNAEYDMPPGLWYRQLARQQGRPVADIRAEYRHRDSERPRGVVRPQVPQPEPVDVVEILWTAIQGLNERLARVEPRRRKKVRR